jgi:hypothetical protein
LFRRKVAVKRKQKEMTVRKAMDPQQHETRRRTLVLVLVLKRQAQKRWTLFFRHNRLAYLYVT